MGVTIASTHLCEVGRVNRISRRASFCTKAYLQERSQIGNRRRCGRGIRIHLTGRPGRRWKLSVAVNTDNGASCV